MMMTKNKDYWVQRTKEIMSKADKSDLDFFYEMQEVFLVNNKAIQDAVFSFYQSYAIDHTMTYAEAMKRLKKEELRDYQANANKYFKMAEKDPDLLKRLNAQYMSAKVRRLESLDFEISAIVLAMGNKLDKDIDSYLTSVAQSVYEDFGTDSQVNLDVIKTIVTSQWQSGNYSSRIWEDTERLVEKLKTILKQGFVRDQTPAEMARMLRKEFNVTRAQAETLVRTECTHVITKTTIDNYKAAGYKEYEFMAYIDQRTSVICKKLNKEKFAIDMYEAGVNAPPMHPNCRSTIIPVIKD